LIADDGGRIVSPAHSHAGNGLARRPAFDVLPGDFWRILDRGRGGWKKPQAQAFR
jgi:hypothetical protein